MSNFINDIKMYNSEDIRRFLAENNFSNYEEDSNSGTKLFNNEKINTGRFLELILFLEERFNITFLESELLPNKFDTFEKIDIIVSKKIRNDI